MIDILKVGPDSGLNQILVCVESLSKWVEIFALKNHTALTIIAECLFTLSSRFDSIKSLFSDNGGEMKNAIIKHFCQMSGCHTIFGSMYKSSSQGLVERNNHTILQRLKLELMGKQNWASMIDTVLFALRGTPL